MTVGIIAFGSIVDDPGREVRAATTRRFEVQTPFPVEFARASRTRDGAPTLVPVAVGGSPVQASLLELSNEYSEDAARDMLYRRETRRVGDRITYRQAGASWINKVIDFAGVAVCIYTALPANISPLTVQTLAELALSSARASAGSRRHDGISYLDEQRRRGLRTPLMPGYEQEILARTGARDLQDAWTRVRGKAIPGSERR